MSNVTASIVISSLAHIKDASTSFTPIQLGIQREDFVQLSKDVHWHHPDRNSVINTFDLLCHGVTDGLGLPRLELPAEYIAAAAAIWIAPCNHYLFSSWFVGRNIVHNQDTMLGIAPDTADSTLEGAELFSMILVANEHFTTKKRDSYIAAFNKQLSIAIENATENE